MATKNICFLASNISLPLKLAKPGNPGRHMKSVFDSGKISAQMGGKSGKICDVCQAYLKAFHFPEKCNHARSSAKANFLEILEGSLYI